MTKEAYAKWREMRKREAEAPRVWIVFTASSEEGEFVAALFSSEEKRDEWLAAARTHQEKMKPYYREKYVSRSYGIDWMKPESFGPQRTRELDASL